MESTGTESLVTTGTPNRSPPRTVRPVSPSAACMRDRDKAVSGCIAITAVSSEPSKAAKRALMSARTASASVPEDGTGVTPLVTDAGD
ncbi:hypothetical protein D3C80_1774920 [compost metagenome]